MKNGMTVIATIFGTVFSVFEVSANEAFKAFFLGGLGSVGAYVFLLAAKWIIKKIGKLVE